MVAPVSPDHPRKYATALPREYAPLSPTLCAATAAHIIRHAKKIARGTPPEPKRKNRS